MITFRTIDLGVGPGGQAFVVYARESTGMIIPGDASMSGPGPGRAFPARLAPCFRVPASTGAATVVPSASEMCGT
jgi:hypothetical protein